MTKTVSRVDVPLGNNARPSSSEHGAAGSETSYAEFLERLLAAENGARLER